MAEKGKCGQCLLYTLQIPKNHWDMQNSAIKNHDPQKKKMVSWTSWKLKTSVPWKTLFRKWKDKPDFEKTFAKHTFDKNLVSKIYKEFLTLNGKERTQLKKKNGKNLERHLTKQDIQMESKDVKRCSASYVIKELQFKKWGTIIHLLQCL